MGEHNRAQQCTWVLRTETQALMLMHYALSHLLSLHVEFKTTHHALMLLEVRVPVTFLVARADPEGASLGADITLFRLGCGAICVSEQKLVYFSIVAQLHLISTNLTESEGSQKLSRQNAL